MRALLASTVLCLGLFGQFTVLPPPGAGGGVGGASNLTTAGAVPYVSSAGVLTQDASGLFYSSGSGLLGVGTGSPVAGYRQTIVQPDNSSYTGLHIRANNLSQDMSIGWAGISTTGAFNLNTNTSGINLQIAGVTKVSMAPTTGNLLLGTTTDDGSNKLQVAGNARVYSSSVAGQLLIGGDGVTTNHTTFLITSNDSYTSQQSIKHGVGYKPLALNPLGANVIVGSTVDGNYKLDIASSGSSGALRVFNQTAGGSTLAVIQAGDTQSGNLLSIRNNAGTEISSIDSNGFINAYASGTITARLLGASGYGVELASNRLLLWDAVASITGAPDTGVARNAAGVVEINNGTAGTLRDLLLRYLQNTGVTVATLPAAAAGNAGSRAYVTDANATTIGTTVAGGGANKVMVWSDGTNWKIYAN